MSLCCTSTKPDCHCPLQPAEMHEAFRLSDAIARSADASGIRGRLAEAEGERREPLQTSPLLKPLKYTV